MNALYAVNMIACATIFAWSSWCVVTRWVHCGILGRSMFAMAALASLAVIVGPQGGYSGARAAEVTLNLSMAMLGARHVTMRFIWPRIVRRCRKARHSGGKT